MLYRNGDREIRTKENWNISIRNCLRPVNIFLFQKNHIIAVKLEKNLLNLFKISGNLLSFHLLNHDSPNKAKMAVWYPWPKANPSSPSTIHTIRLWRETQLPTNPSCLTVRWSSPKDSMQNMTPKSWLWILTPNSKHFSVRI